MSDDRYDDRDLDGIPDKYDSTFNTPEEVLEKKGIKKPVYPEKNEEKSRNQPEKIQRRRRSR